MAQNITEFTSIKALLDHVEQALTSLSDPSEYIVDSSLESKASVLLSSKEEGWFEQLFTLMTAENNQYTISVNRRLSILKKFCLLAEMEKNSGITPFLYQCTSLNEMESVYRRSLFYIRRLIFKPDSTAHDHFIPLFKEWNFSLNYFVMVLNDSAVSHDGNVQKKLAQSFSEINYEEYAKLVLSIH